MGLTWSYILSDILYQSISNYYLLTLILDVSLDKQAISFNTFIYHTYLINDIIYKLTNFSRLVAFTSRLQFLRFCESNTILVSKIRHSDLLQTGYQKCGSNFVISDTTIGYMQY